MRAPFHFALATGLLALGLVQTSCVRFSYVVRTVDAPLPDEVLQPLQPGVSDLTTCLSHLGAPNFVFEYRVHGMALLWRYVDSAGWGASLSYSVDRVAPSASLNFDSDDADTTGVMLWFDQDLRLIRWQKGLVSQLTAGFRRQPTDLEQVEDAGGAK